MICFSQKIVKLIFTEQNVDLRTLDGWQHHVRAIVIGTWRMEAHAHSSNQKGVMAAR
jgi:hypothetical protein